MQKKQRLNKKRPRWQPLDPVSKMPLFSVRIIAISEFDITIPVEAESYKAALEYAKLNHEWEENIADCEDTYHVKKY